MRLYGIRQDNFDKAIALLETFLPDVTFSIRESSFYGYGEYASFKKEGCQLILFHNWDDFDQEPVEENFSEYNLLLEIHAVTLQGEEISDLFADKLLGFGEEVSFLEKRILKKKE